MTTVDSMQSCGHSKYDCRFDCLTCLQFTVNELNGRVSKALQSQTLAESQLTQVRAQLESSELALENERKSWRLSDDGHYHALRRAESAELELTQVREELRQANASLAEETYMCLQLRQQVEDIMPQAQRCAIAEIELGKAEAENKALNQELAELREVLDAKENSEDDINR